MSGSAGVTAKPWTLGKRRHAGRNPNHHQGLHERPQASGVSASGSLSMALAAEAGAKVVVAEEHRLTGHAGAVLCMRVHQQRLLFTGSTDGLIKACAGVTIPLSYAST